MNRGFVIMAQGQQYEKCAYLLEKNIKKLMPDENVTVITMNDLPYGDQCTNTEWKLQNDWQVYYASPYDCTIKLEADMLLPKPIDYYWDILKQKELVVCTTIRNYKQEISKIRTYRRFIDDNQLPDCYNGITYFKKSVLAKKFFDIVRDVFENWVKYKTILKCNIDEIATTDWAYAIACHILGKENTTLPTFTDMSMVHMKSMINDLPVEDWTKILVYEVLPHTIRINTIPQQYPFHYHIKEFQNNIESNIYE
jgi:hypothetical protein